MKSHSTARRQGGFTLVEIAIVLMIIGLLIGGILRGQELIQSARVRNIIDQKSAIQTAYIGFLDRYRMLPGDLTATQAAVVGNGAEASTAALGGDGLIAPTESILFFQNLTSSGFLSCGACMTVTAAGPVGINNSPINVYGDAVRAGHLDSSNTAAANSTWFDPVNGITRMVVYTGASVPSQVLAETDRKADDGLPGTGQLRFGMTGTSGAFAICAPNLATNPTATTWANPTQANCAGAWLF